MNEYISRLSPTLFWDVDRETVDVARNERWLVIREVYGKTGLKRLMPTLRLDPKSTNFLRLYCSL
jgi:hypothetical protein